MTCFVVINDAVYNRIMDEIKKELCQKFCPYYKPLKKDELACMGFLVVERLLKKGEKILFDKSKKKLDAVTQEILIQNMCIACLFYENDCDFIVKSPHPPFTKGRIIDSKEGFSDNEEHPPPCGGFILLGHLLEKNIISIDDIKNII